ncbi:MAG TPA: transporter substrate-binding domain-containing protein, partial [Anaerolineae bacterium]|nr:transporter substrate-binding domain-containing protein [Anaerolineae bacterium]
MRSRLTHILIPLLVILLFPTSCWTTEKAPTPTPTATVTPSPPPPTPTPLPDDATTGARILHRGYLRVGVRYDLFPFGYITDEGEVAGFGVDMGRELARRWLGDPQAVEFRQVRSDTAIEHLQAGDVDLVIAALVHTQEREAGADFGQPYFTDGHALLVRGPDAGLIDGPPALQGRTVGVVAWEQTADVLREAVPFTLTLQTFDRFDAAVAALGQGEVDAVADLRHRLFWGQKLLLGSAIVGQFTSAPVSFAFPQNDPFFADLVMLTFQEMVADGTFAAIYTHWFARDDPPAVEIWPGDEVPALTETPLMRETRDTIAAIESRGYLRVAMPPDRSPFAYLDSTGIPAGYEVGLVQRMAARWLGDVQAVQFVTTTIDTGREMLRSGQVDMLIGGLAHTRAAELQQDFSLTTYIAGEGLLIWAGTPITDLHSLQGQQVAVVQGSGSGETL